MMSLSLDFLWDFLKPVLSDKFTKQLDTSGASQTKKDLLTLHEILMTIEQKTDLFVGSIGEIVAVDRQKLHTIQKDSLVQRTPSEGEMSQKLEKARQNANDLLQSLLDLANIMERIAPKMSVYKYNLIQEIYRYKSSRALVISKLEEEINKIEQGDYNSTVINELYLKSLENLQKIKKASSEVRQFIASQYDFKNL
jgi:hypothetical protein